MKSKQPVTAPLCTTIQLLYSLLGYYYPFKSKLSFQNHWTPHNENAFDCRPWARVKDNMIPLMVWFGHHLCPELSKVESLFLVLIFLS